MDAAVDSNSVAGIVRLALLEQFPDEQIATKKVEARLDNLTVIIDLITDNVMVQRRGKTTGGEMPVDRPAPGWTLHASLEDNGLIMETSRVNLVKALDHAVRAISADQLVSEWERLCYHFLITPQFRLSIVQTIGVAHPDLDPGLSLEFKRRWVEKGAFDAKLRAQVLQWFASLQYVEMLSPTKVQWELEATDPNKAYLLLHDPVTRAVMTRMTVAKPVLSSAASMLAAVDEAIAEVLS